MPEQKPKKRDRFEARRQRAEAYFWMYYELGPERSLEKLCDRLALIGPRRALNTLKNYSVAFGWQTRLAEVDAKLAAQRENDRLQKIQDMNERQARGGRNLQAIAGAGMLYLQELIKRSGQLKLKPADVAVLMEKGQKIERLAMGEATDRREAINICYNVMLLGFIEIVKKHNTLPDPEERLARIAEDIDHFRDRKLIELNP